MAYGEGMNRLNPCGDELILSLLEAYCPAPTALLDAGCGRGDRLAALHRALPETALTGIDLDAENAAAARQRCPAAAIVAGDLCAPPHQPGGYAAALCECTLSLTAAPETALAALHRALAPGGVLLLGDLCAEGTAPPVPLGGDGVRRLFSRGWLEAEFLRAGFRIRDCRDCREALLTMAAQMIFDGSFDACVDCAGAAALRVHRAGYRLWVLEKGDCV